VSGWSDRASWVDAVCRLSYAACTRREERVKGEDLSVRVYASEGREYATRCKRCTLFRRCKPDARREVEAKKTRREPGRESLTEEEQRTS
jgi:hypothetical protein